MIRRKGRDEAGASIVLALIFLSLFGLFISTILTFTESSLLVSRQARISAGEIYTSDGAMEGAIALLRNDRLKGLEGSACEPFVLEVTTVQCVPSPGSGRDIRLREPAIVAYGTDPNEGVRVAGADDMVVGGDVVSNSKVVLDSEQRLQVFGDAAATGACEPSSSSIVSLRDGLVECSTGTIEGLASPGPKFIRSPLPDPGSPEMPRREPPIAADACAAPSRTISLEPGYYDDAAGLNALSGPGSPCQNADKVLHFRPGLYYFDFGSGQSTPCSEPTPTCEWVIDLPTGGVVGGKPTSPAPDPFNRPLLSQGNCVDDDVIGNGVQFVFGGESRLSIQVGVVELCGENTADGKEAVFYGLPAKPLRDRISSPPVNTPGSGSDRAQFVLPETHAQFIDGSLSEARLEGSRTTASIDFKFPMMFPQIPAAASIDEVKLRIGHKELGDLANLGLSVRLTSAVVPPAFAPQIIPLAADNTVLAEDEIDLKVKYGFDTREEVNSGIDITFVATRAATESVTELLDGIELGVAWTAASIHQPLVLKAASAISNPANTFVPDDNVAARTIDGRVAQATLNSGRTTASVDVTFPSSTPETGVPSDAAIETAVLRVAHAETGDPNTSLGLTVGVTPATGAPLADQSLPADNPTIATDVVDLRALGLDTPGELNAGLAVRFTASWLSGGDVTESLDGMELAVTYNLLATKVTSLPAGRFLPDDGLAARTIDGTPAKATLTTTEPASVNFEFPALTASTEIPQGASVKSALLRVAHAETSGFGRLDLLLAVTPKTGTAAIEQPLPGRNEALTEETVDLMALGLDTPAELNPGMTVEFRSRFIGLGSVTESLDGVELTILYSPPPTYRPATPGGCLLQPAYGQPGSCPLLRVGSAATVAVHGGVYAPAAPVELSIAGSSVLIDRGIAVRTVRATVLEAVVAPPAATVLPVQPTSASATRFEPNDGVTARTIDGASARARLNNRNRTASVTSSFPILSPGTVPPGSTIQGAVLRVAHAETMSRRTRLDLAVVATPTPASPSVTQSLAPDNRRLTTDTVDLLALGLDTPEELLSGLQVQFKAALRNRRTSTVSLDGMALEVTYTPPAGSPGEGTGVTCPLQALPSKAPREVTLSTTNPVEIEATVELVDRPCRANDDVTVLDWGVRRGP